jgi:hypothetical protein
MSISSEKPSSERPAEIGPPPYYHRSDCNICRKQDGLKTGSELLDSGRPGVTSVRLQTSRLAALLNPRASLPIVHPAKTRKLVLTLARYGRCTLTAAAARR